MQINEYFMNTWKAVITERITLPSSLPKEQMWESSKVSQYKITEVDTTRQWKVDMDMEKFETK